MQFQHAIAQAIHAERIREIEARGRRRGRIGASTPQRSIRRRIGMEIVRFGSTIAGSPLQAASR